MRTDQGVEFPGAEKGEAFQTRVSAVFDEIAAQHTDGPVGVVSHGGVLGAFLNYVIGLPTWRSSFRFGNGSLSVVEVDTVRQVLADDGINDAVVQHFGTARDVMIRLPAGGQDSAASLSAEIIRALRQANGETLVEGVEGQDKVQECVKGEATRACEVQMRRVEYVGPQVGDELANQGGLAMIYALIGILIYVTFRFKWQFSIGSVIALVHDVVITLGAFALFQFDFSLSVLAAVLAVIGYSLNDTIVVFDRIRENFRRMRKGDRIEVINAEINDTLPRTILSSMTTLFVLVSAVFCNCLRSKRIFFTFLSNL